ncbi:MAG TPA: hypothetical protein VNR51_02425 [Hyphomicrobium sp.]|nr:hypothetical protein [Hyphomicrobium sp.]
MAPMAQMSSDRSIAAGSAVFGMSLDLTTKVPHDAVSGHNITGCGQAHDDHENPAGFRLP